MIDQATGAIGSTSERPMGTTRRAAPIRVSANGRSILLGSGDIYNRSGLTWARSIRATIKDARWFADGSFVGLLQTAGNQTSVHRLNGTTVLEQRNFAGLATTDRGNSDSKMSRAALEAGSHGTCSSATTCRAMALQRRWRCQHHRRIPARYSRSPSTPGSTAIRTST